MPGGVFRRPYRPGRRRRWVGTTAAAPPAATSLVAERRVPPTRAAGPRPKRKVAPRVFTVQPAAAPRSALTRTFFGPRWKPAPRWHPEPRQIELWKLAGPTPRSLPPIRVRHPASAAVRLARPARRPAFGKTPAAPTASLPFKAPRIAYRLRSRFRAFRPILAFSVAPAPSTGSLALNRRLTARVVSARLYRRLRRLAAFGLLPAFAVAADQAVFILNFNRIRLLHQQIDGDPRTPEFVVLPDHPAWLPNRPRIRHQRIS